MITWYPEYTSVFAYLLEDVDYPGIWEPFTFVTEERQEELLIILCERPKKKSRSQKSRANRSNSSNTARVTETAAQNFQKVDRDTRRLLKQSYNFRLVQCLEHKLLTSFVHQNEQCRLAEMTNIYDEELQRDSEYYFAEWNSNGNNNNEIMILLENSRDRKVAHGVCTFYGLLSASENRAGNRVTVIWKPKPMLNRSLSIPQQLLSSYLQSKSAGNKT